MATPTDDNNPQLSAPEAVQPTIGDQHEANVDTSKGASQTSVFVNSEPVREDQVQNAVKFLSHPKVRGSAVMYRRSFLERKGLTKEEIDEAFRRVPDPATTASAVQPTTSTPDSQMKLVSNVQPQVASQNQQPSAALVGVNPNQGVLSRFHWSHALAAIGILAISGAGTAVIFKRSIVPRLKSWIRKVVLEEEEASKKITGKPSLEEEAAAAAKAAAAAAADVARVSQEMLISKSEEKKSFEELMSLLGMQIQEMKSMSNALRNLEENTAGRAPLVEREQRVSVSKARSNVNGTADFYSGSSPSPSNTEPSAAPHPKSYMEIMAMIQRGEKPSNIREINDMPPNPNQPLPTPQLAPRPKPWEVNQTQSSFPQALQPYENSNGINYNSMDNGFTNQRNGDNPTPWGLKKNVRISEIENDNEMKTADVATNTRPPPVQRSWVPPQPPPVAMPEAAAAIRQPKKPISQKSLTDDQLLGVDELQRVTKISESGGVLDTQSSESIGQVYAEGGSSGLNTSEIQEEQEAY